MVFVLVYDHIDIAGISTLNKDMKVGGERNDVALANMKSASAGDVQQFNLIHAGSDQI